MEEKNYYLVIVNRDNNNKIVIQHKTSAPIGTAKAVMKAHAFDNGISNALGYVVIYESLAEAMYYEDNDLGDPVDHYIVQ